MANARTAYGAEMMHYWNTGDRATDSNLQKLSSVTDWPVDRDIENNLLLDYIHLLICIEEMLPRVCKAHFHWPNLFIGSAPTARNQRDRNNFWRNVCEKIQEGLENVAADPTLKANGGADLNDRPKSRGERILDALARYEEARSPSALSGLMTAGHSASIACQHGYRA
jgi:hypothetical protein